MANKTNKEMNIKIGQMLQTAREDKRITQEEVAKIIGISKQHLSAVERGVNKASIEMLLGYCKALDITPNEILGYSEKDIPKELKDKILSMDTANQQKLSEMAAILLK